MCVHVCSDKGLLLDVYMCVVTRVVYMCVVTRDCKWVCTCV